MVDVVVRAARIGKGVFTKRRFRAGEALFSVRGTVVRYTVLNRRGGTFQDNCFRFGPETYLSPAGELGDFLNHSCEPNAKVVKERGKLFIVAITPIARDVEIVIDYSTILAADDIWRMRCRCGAPHCRRVIRAFSTLPQELQDSYVAAGIVPQYILRIF